MKLIYATPLKQFLAASMLTASLFICTLTRVSAQSDYNRASINVPALLLGFNGEMGSGSSVLSWTMENETNSKWFVIERSSNTDNFDSIGIVMSVNNNHETDYKYKDGKLLSGHNYYRLRLVSMDGLTKYSKVVCVENASNISVSMQVFPNPAASMVNYRINSPAEDHAIVQVYNLAGVLVLSEQRELSAGLNQQSIALSNLKSGNYFLKVRGANGAQYAQPFVKFM